MNEYAIWPIRHAGLRTLVLCAVFALGGCDGLGLGGSTFRGVVVDAETEAPIEGIHVSLKVGASNSFVGSHIIEADFTDENGEFRLRTSRNDTQLYVNAPGFGLDEHYRADYGSAGPLPRRERRIELEPQSE